MTGLGITWNATGTLQAALDERELKMMHLGTTSANALIASTASGRR